MRAYVLKRACLRAQLNPIISQNRNPNINSYPGGRACTKLPGRGRTRSCSGKAVKPGLSRNPIANDKSSLRGRQRLPCDRPGWCYTQAPILAPLTHVATTGTSTDTGGTNHASNANTNVNLSGENITVSNPLEGVAAQVQPISADLSPCRYDSPNLYRGYLCMPHYQAHLYSPIQTPVPVVVAPTCVSQTDIRFGVHTSCAVLTHKPSTLTSSETTICSSTKRKSLYSTNRRSSRKFSSTNPYLLRSARQALHTGSSALYPQMESTNSLLKSVNPIVDPGHGLTCLMDPISAGCNLDEQPQQPMNTLHSGSSMPTPGLLHGNHNSPNSNSTTMSAGIIHSPMPGIGTNLPQQQQQHHQPSMFTGPQSVSGQQNATRIQQIISNHHSSSDRTPQTVVIDGKAYELHDLVNLISRLKQDVLACTDRIRWLEAELHQSRLLVSARDRDIHKLRSVLDQKVPTAASPIQTTQLQSMDTLLELDETPNRLSTTAYDSLISCGSPALGLTSKTVPETTRMKKQGVSGESQNHQRTSGLVHHRKDTW